MGECVHDFVSMRIVATVDMCQLCGVPEPAYTIAKLKAELAELREAVGKLLNDNSPQNREDVYALLEVKDE